MKSEAISRQRIFAFIQNNTALWAVLILMLFGTLSYGMTFLNYKRNLINVLHTASMMGIMGVGVNLCFLIGARDLSVASVAASASMFSALLSPWGLLPSILGGLSVGLVFGLINGIIVAKFRVQPFIATLGTQLAARGLALLVNKELSITIADSANTLKAMGNANLFDLLPVPALLFISLVLVFMIVTRYTPFGRAMYAVGGNEEAAEMMGIRVTKTKIWVFILSGLTAALCGIVLSGRLSAGQPTACEGWEMTIMAAIVIGGTSVRGGMGKIQGIFLGSLFLNLITNLINLNGHISAYWKDISTGVILLVAVLLQVYSDHQREKIHHRRAEKQPA
ncbi:ABC transporter permease [Oscillospiraceae bacterium MB08-C2-2]|nr:ABC transporter permease [Oscillospiraceae bacterium MB08-C2-2]